MNKHDSNVVAWVHAMTTAQLILIAIGVVLVILLLIWGSSLARRRRQARETLIGRGELVEASAKPQAAAPAEPAMFVPTASPVADVPPAPEPPAPEPVVAPVAEAPAVEPAPAPAEPEAVVPQPGGAPRTEDLTRLKGVGPRLAERLNNAGITSFAQLAALTPDDVDALDAQLGDFRGRITRDRWIEQAGYLAKDDIAGFESVFGKL